MPELNREDIIKALECCSQKPYADCNNCPYKDSGLECFVSEVPKNALTLIKQLIEENERSKSDVVPRSEVERLEAELEDKQFRCDSCDRIALTSSEHRFCVSQAKQDVAREIIDNISRYISLNENISKKCKEENGEQNREYFKGKLSAFLQVQGFIDIELKRQYKVVKNEA